MAGFHPNNLVLKPNTPTFALQELLPRLPIPDLDDTLELFLTTMEPLVSSDELQQIRALAADFASSTGPGQRLHELLQQREAELAALPNSREYPNASWLEGWWDYLAYLSDRTPLPTNVNVFGTLFECQTDPDPTWKAAQMIRGLLAVKLELDAQTLQPDCLGRSGQLPLCMFQFTRNFATTRVPGEAVDEFVTHADSRHVAVQCRGHWFRVDVQRASDGEPLSTADIDLQLRRVRAEAARLPAPPHAVSQLTFLRRDEWAAVRESEAMLGDAGNAAALRDIESALFALSLSDAAPQSPTELMQLCEHGHGAELWADKSISLFVCANGRCGFNGEHGVGDAPVAQRLLYAMFVHMQELPASRRAAPTAGDESLPAPARAAWRFSPALCAALAGAANHTRLLLEEAQTFCLYYNRFGRTWLRANKVPPDAFMQLSLQLAFWRDQGRQTATYESATMRTFLHGRTECIRSLTNESRAFVAAMADPAIGNAARADLLRKAMRAHTMLTQRCMLGQGCDRHLLGLRMTAFENGEEPHALFTHPAFAKWNTFELSTSQMAFETLNAPGFGAPYLGEGMPGSYGACYVVTQPDDLVCTITSRLSDPTKDAERFGRVLEQAMDDLAEVLGFQSRL